MSWTLVWLRPAATLWEKDWLAFLFGDCLKETRDGFHLVDRALVVIQNYNEAFPFIVAYEQSGLRYCLVHISDEGLDATAYAPRCRLIFRNYIITPSTRPTRASSSFRSDTSRASCRAIAPSPRSTPGASWATAANPIA